MCSLSSYSWFLCLICQHDATLTSTPRRDGQSWLVGASSGVIPMKHGSVRIRPAPDRTPPVLFRLRRWTGLSETARHPVLCSEDTGAREVMSSRAREQRGRGGSTYSWTDGCAGTRARPRGSRRTAPRYRPAAAGACVVHAGLGPVVADVRPPSVSRASFARWTSVSSCAMPAASGPAQRARRQSR